MEEFIFTSHWNVLRPSSIFFQRIQRRWKVFPHFFFFPATCCLSWEQVKTQIRLLSPALLTTVSSFPWIHGHWLIARTTMWQRSFAIVRAPFVAVESSNVSLWNIWKYWEEIKQKNITRKQHFTLCDICF